MSIGSTFASRVWRELVRVDSEIMRSRRWPTRGAGDDLSVTMAPACYDHFAWSMPSDMIATHECDQVDRERFAIDGLFLKGLILGRPLYTQRDAEPFAAFIYHFHTIMCASVWVVETEPYGAHVGDKRRNHV